MHVYAKFSNKTAAILKFCANITFCILAFWLLKFPSSTIPKHKIMHRETIKVFHFLSLNIILNFSSEDTSICVS